MKFSKDDGTKLSNVEKFFLTFLFISIYLTGSITKFINFKFYYNLSDLISKLIPKNILYTIKLINDIHFSFYLHDPYYNRLINKNFEYEPEIKNVLKKIKNLKYLF